jgi:hypothetical protein
MRDIIKQLEVVGCIMTCPPLSCQRKRAAGPRRKGAHHAPEPTQGCTLSACEALRQARAPGLPVGWDAGRCAAAVRGRGLAGGAWPCFALCSLLGCGLWAAGPALAPSRLQASPSAPGSPIVRPTRYPPPEKMRKGRSGTCFQLPAKPAKPAAVWYLVLGQVQVGWCVGGGTWWVVWQTSQNYPKPKAAQSP